MILGSIYIITLYRGLVDGLLQYKCIARRLCACVCKPEADNREKQPFQKSPLEAVEIENSNSIILRMHKMLAKHATTISTFLHELLASYHPINLSIFAGGEFINGN